MKEYPTLTPGSIKLWRYPHILRKNTRLVTLCLHGDMECDGECASFRNIYVSRLGVKRVQTTSWSCAECLTVGSPLSRTDSTWLNIR